MGFAGSVYFFLEINCQLCEQLNPVHAKRQNKTWVWGFCGFEFPSTYSTPLGDQGLMPASPEAQTVLLKESRRS